jgi:hypothetical protein
MMNYNTHRTSVLLLAFLHFLGVYLLYTITLFSRLHRTCTATGYPGCELGAVSGDAHLVACEL